MDKNDRDHRANTKNPTSDAYKKANDNRGNQLDPNHPEYKKNKNVQEK